MGVPSELPLFILDCRFPYEYEAGHIKGSMNILNPDELQSIFFNEIIEGATIVVHCEFSQHRGPIIASKLRELDRNINKDNYPSLYYPNLYILKNGFKEFSQTYPNLIDGYYLPMRDNRELCEKNLSKWNEMIIGRQRRELQPSPIASYKTRPRHCRTESSVLPRAPSFRLLPQWPAR